MQDRKIMLERAKSPNPLRLLETRLYADPSRVVLRPFHLGWQSSNAPADRANRLVADIVALSEDEVDTEYYRVVRDFAERHWQTERIFADRFGEVAQNLALNPAEVAEAFEVPLAFLMDGENHRRASRIFDGVERHFYEMPFGTHYIWGATAGIIRALYERMYP